MSRSPSSRCPAGATAVPAAADHAAPGATGLVLVHGSWCGAWAWGLVEPHLTAAGLRVLAIDLPGHGLHARLPEPFLHRPLDAEAFAAAPSAMAGIGAAELAAAVAGAARRLRAAGARRVVAVGHSMGGVPVSHAAARWPALFDGLIYLAAYAALPGKAPAAHLRLPEQVARGLLPGICMGDARHIGALRIDPRSEDPGYLARMAEALGDDLPAELMAVVRHLMTPDAPALIYREQAAFDPAAAAHSRSYVRCLRDRTVLPSTGAAIAADMTAAWPDRPCRLVDLDAGHLPMFSCPEKLAGILVALARDQSPVPPAPPPDPTRAG